MSPSSPADPASDPGKPSKGAVFVRRLASTLILWGLVVLGLWFQQAWLFFVLIAGLALLSLWETLEMFKVRREPVYFGWTLLVSVAYLLTTFFFWRNGAVHQFQWDVGFFVLLFLGLFTFALRHRPDGLKTLLPLMGAIFSFFYVVLCFNFVTRILFFFEGSEETAGNGAYFVLFLVAATKFTDMGAYLLGSMIGKHKMIPHISPGKTWQGLVGGFLGAIGGAFLIRGLCSERLAALGWGHALVLAVILGAAAVVGDLAESILKRSLEVKDSGAMLPGIGGALDLIDSLCFTAPLLYLYLVLFAV